MKRFAAYIMDYMIMTLIFGVLNIAFFMNIKNWTLRWILAFLFIYLFFWLNDFIFKGSSIGKKIVNMRITIKGDSVFAFATVHAALKLFFTFIWIISFVLFLVWNKHMPYDKWLYSSIE